MASLPDCTHPSLRFPPRTDHSANLPATWQNTSRSQTLASQGLGTRTVPFCQFATLLGPRLAGSAPRQSDPSVTARVRCRLRSTTVALVSLLGWHPGSAPAKQDSLHVARIALTPPRLHCIAMHCNAFHCISLHLGAAAFHASFSRRLRQVHGLVGENFDALPLSQLVVMALAAPGNKSLPIAV